jgi:hypothetical protein
LQRAQILPTGRNCAIELYELDSQGYAVRNPRIKVGIWDEEKGELTQVKGGPIKDITLKVKDMWRDQGVKFYWFEESRDKEGRVGGRQKEVI